jgi:hypothetical protein
VSVPVSTEVICGVKVLDAVMAMSFTGGVLDDDDDVDCM